MSETVRAKALTVDSSLLHLPGLVPSPWHSLGPVRWSDHSWSPTLRTSWKQENLGKEFVFTINSCNIDPVTYHSSKQSDMNRTGFTDPCNHFGLFAFTAWNPWNQEGLRELGCFDSDVDLQISETHGDNITKKLLPPGNAWPLALITTSPFKILVHGEILLVHHHQALCVSTSKVGETKFIGGYVTEIVILLGNISPGLLCLGHGGKC